MTSPHVPITDLDALATAWVKLLEPNALRGRNLWLMFMRRDATAVPALTQICGLDLAPDAVAISSLADMVRRMLEEHDGLAGVALCLERPGVYGASPFEESWADALTLALADVMSWPVLVRTPGGCTPVRLWTSAA